MEHQNEHGLWAEMGGVVSLQGRNQGYGAYLVVKWAEISVVVRWREAGSFISLSKHRKPPGMWPGDNAEDAPGRAATDGPWRSLD